MYDLRKSNGIVAEVNSHDIDSLLWFTGLPIQRVQAHGPQLQVPGGDAEFPRLL
jgi:myo-inositol 2-dehydrogenase/D-chiro-inositol 1-dehydrogenase/scyllo-inositol 2-dehydrogenase (NAD+)